MQSVLKKVVLIFGVLIFLVVIAAVTVPLLVDVDKYRPQIVKLADENLNGKLEIGKLKLSLWGQIRIDIGGVSLSDSNGKMILSVSDAYFHLPFASVLSGSPELVLKMERPQVSVLKNKNGKINLMGLVKTGGTQAAAPSAGGAKSVTLPALATQSRMTIELHHAAFNYRDEATGLDTKIKDLNFALRDISLSRTMKIELWADLDTKMAGVFSVKGPMRLTGQGKPQISGGKFGQFGINARVDLDQLDISASGSFHKKTGVAANAELVMTATDKDLRVEKFDIKFFNAILSSQASITNFEAPMVQFSMKSNEIDLKPWVELIPMLKEFELGGTAAFSADAKGPAEKLGYGAQFRIAGLTAKAPKLKAQPRFDASIKVSTDQLEDLTVTMKAPGNDLRVHGKLMSFTQPRGTFEITSSGMDLDQLVEFPAPAAAPAAAPATGGGSGGGDSKGAAAAQADYDILLAPLRENKMAVATSATVALNLKLLKAYNVKMTDIGGNLTLKDLTAGLEAFTMKIFSGSVKAGASFALKPVKPTYRFNAQVAGLDLSEAVASQFHLFRNTVLGKAAFDASGEGVSFNPAPATQNLKLKGKMRVDQATFTTIDVAKMATEGLNKALDKIGDKIPAAKGKKIGAVSTGDSKYEYISSDFSMADGKFSMPNFVGKAAAGKGLDLKGSVQIGFKDLSLNSAVEIIDTHNVTHARDLSVEQAGVKVDHLLAEGNGPVRFPVHAGCTLAAPCYSYTEVPEFLAKVAMANVTAAATGRAKAEVKKKVEALIPSSAPPAVQEGLKKLFGN